jgi:hypothetical protein
MLLQGNLIGGRSALSQRDLFEGGWYTRPSLPNNCVLLFAFHCIISSFDFGHKYQYWVGFVCSKKPVAEALCEAVLLARLREEQWNNMPRKRRKEIYVLVRNLRSSSYRLALATIVLEQEEDVEFM